MVLHTNLIWEFVRLFIVEQGKIRDGSCFYFIPHAVRSRQANFGTCITFRTILPLIFRTIGDSFKNFRRAPPSFLYGSPPPHRDLSTTIKIFGALTNMIVDYFGVFHGIIRPVRFPYVAHIASFICGAL